MNVNATPTGWDDYSNAIIQGNSNVNKTPMEWHNFRDTSQMGAKFQYMI
jgi:hypothetical protein